MTRDPVRPAIQAGVYLLLYIVAVYLLSPVLMFLGGYLVGLTVGGLLAAALCNALSLRIFTGKGLTCIGLPWNGAAARHVGLGVACGCAAAVLVLSVPLSLHYAQFVPSPDAGANWRTFLFVPLLLMCGAVGEEMLFHGFAFQVLLRQFGTFATILPIGVLFGVLHGNNPNASRIGIINTAGFGILFGIAFLRSHDLWLPIGLHFGWNFTLPLFGVNLSGITMKPTGVTIVWNVGSLWSGGDYGVEASALTSVVLAILLAVIWFLPVKRQKALLLEEPLPPLPVLPL